MKKRIVIVEDNYYKVITTRQLLEAKLKLGVSVISVATQGEAEAALAKLKPSGLFLRPAGCVTDLLALLKLRQINCRNSQITLLVTPPFADSALTRAA